jgi:hypothetical protein
MAQNTPSFNFYSSDFLTGTLLMNFLERGMYITLLCVQHQQGHITLEDMQEQCRGQIPPKVMAKFVQDEQGLYFNQRLDKVISDKNDYRNKQADNFGPYKGLKREQIAILKAELAKKGKKEPPEPPSTQNAEDIPNEIKTPAKRFKPPTVEEVAEYCKERNNGVDPFNFVNHYAAKGWRIGKDPMKDWKACVHTWENKNKKNGIIEQGQHPGQNFTDGSVPASYKK